MLAQRAVIALVVVVPFTGGCSVESAGIGGHPTLTDGGSDSAGHFDASLFDALITNDAVVVVDGPVTVGPDAPIAVDAAMDVTPPDAPTPPIDAPIPVDMTPACAAPMKMCGGQCLAAGACCQDSECTAGAPGQVGQCDHAMHLCQYSCAADRKPCAGACIPKTGCCGVDDCAGAFACVNNACSTTMCRTGFKRCGANCIASDACCRADGCCVNNDCGACQKCDAGTCVNQSASEDLKNDCGTSACHTGTCDGNGACGVSPDGMNGPSCSGECLACEAGACKPKVAVCSTGQMCQDGKCPPRPPVAVRINVNGPQYKMFAADPGIGGVCGPTPYQVLLPINGTADGPLYSGEMFGAPLVCAVGQGMLPAGMYHVNLYFAEIYWGPSCPAGGTGVGARVFDIEVEGKVVATNVDIFAEAGCAASLDGSGHPIMKSFLTAITDGTLDLKFDAHVDNAKVSAIEILSAW